MVEDCLGCPGEARQLREVASSLRVKRELEGGWFQWLTLPLPAVLTIQSGINQLRYATLKGIMAAKKKEIRKVPLAAGLASSQEIVALALPARTKQTQIIGGSPRKSGTGLTGQQVLEIAARVLRGEEAPEAKE